MSKLLTEQNFKDAATDLQIEVAVIKAVTEVESKGEGFFPDGRPKILFEAHIFSGKTGHKYDTSHPNISSRKWNRKLYKWGAKEYDRLQEAMALDRVAALKSASYGLFQVMGFNAEICGWDDVETFVDDMYKDENEHLKAFLGFVKANKLTKYLQEKNWAKFAERYNGKEYAQNKYDIKMKEAYEKYSKQVIVEEPKPEELPTTDPTITFGGGKSDGSGASGDY
jgi:hypothetical protein